MSRKPSTLKFFSTGINQFSSRSATVSHSLLFLCRLRVNWKREDCVCLTWGLGQYKLLVSFSPFKLEISCDGEEIVTLNPENKLYFESLQDPTRYQEQYMILLFHTHSKTHLEMLANVGFSQLT